MVGAEGPKIFEFNTSALLEKALNALPSHFKSEQTLPIPPPIPHPVRAFFEFFDTKDVLPFSPRYIMLLKELRNYSCGVIILLNTIYFILYL